MSDANTRKWHHYSGVSVITLVNKAMYEQIPVSYLHTYYYALFDLIEEFFEIAYIE